MSWPSSYDTFYAPGPNDQMDGSVGGPVAYHDVIHDEIAAALTALQRAIGLSGAYHYETKRTLLVTDAGAKFDGSTDDTSGWQAAHDALPASGGVIALPAGASVINGQVTISKPLTFIGQGSGADWNNASDALWKPSTQVLRTSGGGPVFSITGPTGAVQFNGMGIDCAGLAVSGIVADQWQGGGGTDLAIRRSTGYALDLGTSSGTPNVNTMGLCFNGLDLRGVGLLRMTGNAGHTANCCHNTFVRTVGSFSGTDGIHLSDADNNDFYGTFLFCEAGVGSNYGVYFDTYARSNHFYHLEPGVNGTFSAVPHTVTDTNNIWGYDQSNGQASPTIASNPGHQSLVWTSDGSNSTGWNNVSLYQVILKNTTGGPSVQAIKFFDTNTGKSMYVRGLSASGGLSFLNNAFTTVVASLSDTGTLSAANGVQPGNFGTAQTSNIFMGSGVPSNANGSDGDFYFRTDTPGTANQRVYVRSGGAWTGVL